MKVSSALLIVASSALVSCKCFGPECCPGDKIRLELWVHDTAGSSMLDPDTPGYFHLDSIQVFSLVEGQLKPQTTRDQYRHYPVKLDTFRVSGQLHTTIYPHMDPPSTPQMTTTVIRWSANESDTLQFEVVMDCDWPLTKTVWLNGDVSHDRPVEIVK